LNRESGWVRFLPVKVEEEVEEGKRSREGRVPGESSTIEVSIGKSQVRITGRADAEVVRAVLECLSR